jgi:hypothetical protein
VDDRVSNAAGNVFRGLRRWALRSAVWNLVLMSAAFGQEADSDTVDQTGSTAESVTVEDIDAAFTHFDDSTELDDATRANVTDLFSQAKAALTEEQERQKAAATYQSWVTTAQQDIDDANQRKLSSTEIYDLHAAAGLELDALVKDQASLEQQVVDARTALLEAQREPQRRLERKARIPEEILAARQSLKDIDENLKAVLAATDLPIVVQARGTLLHARR